MTTKKNINANGKMSNLVGLWATIPKPDGKIWNTVFIYGKADDDHFIVQAICCLSGSPNVMRIASIRDMMEWTFYDNPEWIAMNRDCMEKNGHVAYALNFPLANVKGVAPLLARADVETEEES